MMKTNNICGLGGRQKPRQGDTYNEHGVLVCGICGKPREWHGDFLPQLKDVWACAVCECDLHRNQQRSQEADKQACIKLARMRRSWAFPLDAALSKITLAKDDNANPRATRAVTKYANNLSKNLAEGKNLLLYGDVGTGKTFFAAAVLNAAIDCGYSCLFTSFYREIAGLTKSPDKNGYLQNLKNYDFVVFDDFGTERETPYNLEQIYQIVNARYNARKPSIFTTNMCNAEFSSQDTAKSRIFSRIFDVCEPVIVDGEDRRRARYKML